MINNDLRDYIAEEHEEAVVFNILRNKLDQLFYMVQIL